ncbi:peptidyl-prolyl cis-trans isomerase, FKBP-type family protein [Tritrichomonas foetus]|uniref:peptidylprolyl isomerase n=1 Tax=Tritrichomonas foetus TaxID=1144522 RepID=A0A1J4JG27_9EUKA|nr:peptidyl-prolyl cis-trans isomerase, FKBP-type family protein [Tritrichomonas foetus]|eukprot:OHS96603.1 peptidyl-prolyl cis-trans isomerase, FKBP-type family protein [Tritrichomonas foetus]
MYITWDRKIFKEIIKKGHGPLVKEQDKVKIHYISRYQDGNLKIESTREMNQPYKFFVGEAPTQALDIAVATMRVGEISKFTCDSKYAYGTRGKEPDIPPNASIIYEIEILGIMKTFSSASKASDLALLLNDEAAQYFRAHDVNNAIALYKEAIECIEDYFGNSVQEIRIRTLRNLALMYSKIFDWKQCLINANAVLEFDQFDLKALMRKIEALLGLNDYEKAKEVLEYSLRISRNHPGFERYQQMLKVSS